MKKITKNLWTGSAIRGFMLAMALLGAGFAMPAKSEAITSGPGVWDLMIFGNYDLTALNTGEALKSTSTPTWSNVLNNGYGGGVGVAYWFNNAVAFRLEAQTSLFTIPSAQGGGSLQSSPLTGGFEFKLLGGSEYYLYVVVDIGGAYEMSMTGTSFFGSAANNSWTIYGDSGLGFNLSWVFIEAKVAYMPFALAKGSSGYGNQNALWYVPLTAGFNF